MLKDYYATLQCEKFADRETLKKKFHQLVMQNHPDKAEEQTSSGISGILEAWNVLSNEQSKQAYDKELRQYQASEEYLGHRFAWQSTATSLSVDCPMCGEPISTPHAGKFQCDSCNAVVEVDNHN